MHTPEMYRSLVASADIAVAVLLNVDTYDVEFMPLQPRPFPESTVLALEVEWSPRHLCFVGVMAWTDGSTHTQLEPLPEAVVTKLNRAFNAYLSAFCAETTPAN